MRHVERRRVVEFRVVTTPDNGKFVGNAGEVLKDIRHLDARFSAFSKRPAARQHFCRAGLGELEIQIPKARRQRLACIFCQ